jgi:asparagine synthase (glutamine-hydrolysing)
MCGITGAFISHTGQRDSGLASVVSQMVKAIGHRGPDDTGVHAKDGVALGHARLAVIDLSEAGHQPMMTSNEKVRIVFNGEIYNFKELRSDLKDVGYRFKSQTDTEVILNGYQHWGKEVFSKLRGMFSIAIWDSRIDELILARDHIGKKPLFYAWSNDVFLFGSEIKAILAYPAFPRKPDLAAIHHYLSLQYIPEPWSAFDGIKKVPKASYMVIQRCGHIRFERYWKLPDPEEAKYRPIKELQEELVALIDESVRLRMISDVPVGAFLSGGVDSSAVVAMMARNSSMRIKTFCVGFDESAYDERRYAQKVADRYGTEHHQIVVKANAMDVLPRLVWHYNEPFADPSAVPTFYVSEIARQHVKVALNGDGGDESFLGYGRYKQCLQTEWISRLPHSIRECSTHLSKGIPRSMERHRIPRVIRRWLSYVNVKESLRYAPSIAYFLDQDKVEGYDEQLTPYLHSSSLDLLQRYFEQSSSYVGGAAWADIHTYLPDDLLVKVDIASMANGLEARSPLLDHILMEWAARIPPGQKMKEGETKSLLKRAMEPFLPHDVLYRDKMGFGLPIDQWLQLEMKDFTYDTLLSNKACQRRLIKPNYVRQMLDEHCKGIRSHHTRLWALLMMELWFQMWIDPTEPPVEAAPQMHIMYKGE